jgi:hypothetical protein
METEMSGLAMTVSSLAAMLAEDNNLHIANRYSWDVYQDAICGVAHDSVARRSSFIHFVISNASDAL